MGEDARIRAEDRKGAGNYNPEMRQERVEVETEVEA
jgi:hypothetical protein